MRRRNLFQASARGNHHVAHEALQFWHAVELLLAQASEFLRCHLRAERRQAGADDEIYFGGEHGAVIFDVDAARESDEVHRGIEVVISDPLVEGLFKIMQLAVGDTAGRAEGERGGAQKQGPAKYGFHRPAPRSLLARM